MKVAIIGPQGLPVPPVKGGAIETLIDVILKENEKHLQLDIDVYTVYDEEAIKASKNYSNVNFIFLLKNKKYIKIRNKFISLLRKVFKIDVPYSYATQICKHLKKYNYDKVLIEGDASLSLPIEKVVGKEKVLVHIHHDPLSTNHDQFRKELSHCHQVIAVSDYVKHGLITCMNRDNFNCVTLPNCHQLRNIVISETHYTRQSLGLHDDDIVVIFSGRPIPIKGVKELLLAIEPLLKKYQNIKLLIVGNSGFGNKNQTPYEQELNSIAAKMKDQVVFTGYVPHTQMHEIYSIADIGVVPSICEDAAPLVVLECMASGLPLVVTDSGGIVEYTSSECAYVVKRDESLIPKLTDCIEMLVVNETLRHEMGRCALLKSQDYTTSVYYRNLLSLLKELN